MEFDPGVIAVPFRMQPGLKRLGADRRHLTPLDPASALHAEKARVVRAGMSRLAVAGFDAAPALRAIHARAQAEHPAIDLAAGPLELAFEEDFAVLDGDTGTLPWLCVCVPSHWAPEDKLGRHFTEVHAPVADNAAVQSAAAQLIALVTAGDAWERHVWTITPSARHDQHPRRHARTPWPDAADDATFAARCWWRAERQTFFAVGGGTRQAVFTIRVMLAPLTALVDTPATARLLADALASMSDAVLAYKGLTPARAPLLRWLEERAR